MKLQFSRQIFEKYLNIKFHENPSSGSLNVTDGRTDGQTTKRIVVFRNGATVSNNTHNTTKFVSTKRINYLTWMCKVQKAYNGSDSFLDEIRDDMLLKMEINIL
jgi:hypothetical protein